MHVTTIGLEVAKTSSILQVHGVDRGVAQSFAGGAPEISSPTDLGEGYEAVRRMSPLPVSKASVVPLAIAALVPMLALGAHRGSTQESTRVRFKAPLTVSLTT
jgi:hypothetical protein